MKAVWGIWQSLLSECFCKVSAAAKHIPDQQQINDPIKTSLNPFPITFV